MGHRNSRNGDIPDDQDTGAQIGLDERQGRSLKQYRKQSENWIKRQSERLGVTPDEILEAIRECVWLPEHIEKITNKYELEGYPPNKRLKIVRDAPDYFKPKAKPTPRRRPTEGPGAMAHAFEKAKN